MNINNKILSDITVYAKYAKYLPEHNRRETWDELVTRNMNMHIKKHPKLTDEITHIYDNFVRTKKVLPSMRSLQFGGKAIEVNPSRIFNCSYLPVDDYRAFSETMFLLLSGCGVGFSVQNHHVEKLPEIRKPDYNRRRRYVVNDSIVGWADAIKMLFKSYMGYVNSHIEFDYSDIRNKGERLVTSGKVKTAPSYRNICRKIWLIHGNSLSLCKI
jgi:ribonucleoside-triphosphate reductase (thioredoxin)